MNRATINAVERALQAILDCEEERLQSEMSGMENGFDHPTTKTMFDRAVRFANEAIEELRRAIQ